MKKNPLNYDSWFDYIRLEEAAGEYDKIREVSCYLDTNTYSLSAMYLFLAKVSSHEIVSFRGSIANRL